MTGLLIGCRESRVRRNHYWPFPCRQHFSINERWHLRL